ETQLQMVRYAPFAAKAKISQHQAILRQQIHQGQKVLIRAIHGQPMPANHLPDPIEYPTQFQANRPAAFVSILGTNLLSRPPLTNRKQQFNRKTVHHIEQTGFSQQLVSLILMPFQLSLKRCPVWQPAEQSIIVTFQPAVECPKAST